MKSAAKLSLQKLDVQESLQSYQHVAKVQWAALRASRRQVQGGGTQAMSVYIVEERQRSRCPRAAGSP